VCVLLTIKTESKDNISYLESVCSVDKCMTVTTGNGNSVFPSPSRWSLLPAPAFIPWSITVVPVTNNLPTVQQQYIRENKQRAGPVTGRQCSHCCHVTEKARLRAADSPSCLLTAVVGGPQR